MHTSLYPTRGSRLTEPWIDTLNHRADALRAEGAPVISLGQAVPGFPPPDSCVRGALESTRSAQAHSYTADAGTRELRDATAEWLRAVANAPVDPAEGLMITAGANQAFAVAALTTFGADEDVVLVSPYFFNHEMMVRAAGATPIEVGMDAASGFAVDVDRILSALTPATRAVVVVSPANPSGAVASLADVERLAAELEPRRVFLIVDETYLLFTYDAAPWSATAMIRGGDAGEDRPEGLRYPSASSFENVVVIGSFSKSFAIPGWRLGYLAADPRFISEAMRVQDAMIICAPAAAQQGITAALRETPRYPLEFLPELRKRRDVLKEGIASAGGEWKMTGGGFFALARFPGCDDSFAAATRLLDEAHVLTIPGALFGKAGEGFLRLSYGAASQDDLREALGRIAAIL